MGSANFQRFVQRVKQGQARVVVDQEGAQRFFRDAGRAAVQQRIGGRLLAQRLLLKMVWLLQYLTLLASVGTTLLIESEFVIFAVPLLLVSFLIYVRRRSASAQKLSGHVFAVVACLVLAFISRDRGPAIVAWFILLPLPYLFARLTYEVPALLLRPLALQNERVFDLLYRKTIFGKDVQ